jgi:hypothetical protein
MTAAISPEGYVFIVGGLAFLCSILVFVLLAAANAELNRYRSRRRTLEEADRFRADLDRERDLVKVIGGGNCRVPVEERRAA